MEHRINDYPDDDRSKSLPFLLTLLVLAVVAGICWHFWTNKNPIETYGGKPYNKTPEAPAGGAEQVDSSRETLPVRADKAPTLLDAVENGDLQLLKEAVSAVSRTQLGGSAGSQALLLAIEKESQETIEVLLSSGANPDTSSLTGQNVLHLVVKQGNVGMLQSLLTYGADSNVMSSSGETPLMVAIASDDVASARLLMRYGADPEIKSRAGQSSYDLLKKSSRIVRSKLLLPKEAAAPVKIEKITPPAVKPLVEKERDTKQVEEESPREPPVSYEESESKGGKVKLTRLRVQGQPKGEWRRGNYLSLNSVSVKVRNVGDIEATGIKISVELPSGKIKSLSGPDSLGRNKVATYSQDMSERVYREKKLKVNIVCDNCRR